MTGLVERGWFDNIIILSNRPFSTRPFNVYILTQDLIKLVVHVVVVVVVVINHYSRTSHTVSRHAPLGPEKDCIHLNEVAAYERLKTLCLYVAGTIMTKCPTMGGVH